MIVGQADVTEKSTSDFVQGKSIKVEQLVRESKRIGAAVAIVGRIVRVTYRSKDDEVGLLRKTRARAAVDLEIKVFHVDSGKETVSLPASGKADENRSVAMDEENLGDSQQRLELIVEAVRLAIPPTLPAIVGAVEKMSCYLSGPPCRQ
jgi:hypothetical protein